MSIFKYVPIFIFCIGCTQNKNTNSELEYPKEIDFGTFDKGTTKVVEFTVSNSSVSDINIGEIGSSCSCTSSDKKKVIVKSNSSLKIPLKVYLDSSKEYISEIITLKLENPKKFCFIKIKAKASN